MAVRRGQALSCGPAAQWATRSTRSTSQPPDWCGPTACFDLQSDGVGFNNRWSTSAGPLDIVMRSVSFRTNPDKPVPGRTGTTACTAAIPTRVIAVAPGARIIGTTGTPAVFTVKNYGDLATDALSVVVSSSEFVVSNDTCTGVSLGNKKTCTVSIALDPASAGAKRATLTVTASNGSPAVLTMTGTAISLQDGGVGHD
jgi:hypothetical protein